MQVACLLACLLLCAETGAFRDVPSNASKGSHPVSLSPSGATCSIRLNTKWTKRRKTSNSSQGCPNILNALCSPTTEPVLPWKTVVTTGFRWKGPLRWARVTDVLRLASTDVICLKQEATSNKCHASSNRCLTSSNKKLVVTSATLVVTGALLVVTRS